MIWNERPAKTEVEAVVRRYFDLLRTEQVAEAEQLVDHTPVRHVLKSLRTGSVGASGEAWDGDLSWLGDLNLGDFHWGDSGSHVDVEVIYRAQIIEVSLGFWVKLTDTGWVVAGPSTLW